jgi:hypothetical protein
MKPTTFESRILSVHINHPFQETYDFLSIPENFPQWAIGLGAFTGKTGDQWLVDSPGGPVKVRFTGQNSFGILDHYVTTASGTEIYVPMRVISNGTGSEVTMAQFRLPDMSDEQYAEDTRLMEKDLATLKNLLEA